MESLNYIENKLKNIALANNLSGDSVELLIKLLSYTYYEAVTSTKVSLIEALPSRAVNLNSKIEHAVNEMYSVGRGNNAYIKVPVTVTGTVSLTRFQKVYSDRNNNFYYDSVELDSGEVVTGTYTFIYGSTYILTLIKAEEYISQDLSVDSSNPYLLESFNSNISEDYSIVSSIASSLPLATTKDFGSHLDSSLSDEEDRLVFDLTTVDYGLKLYSPDSDGFNSSVTYSLNYLPFLGANVEESQLSKLTLSGFEVQHDSIEVVKYNPRESADNFLYNLKKEAALQSRVRSNDDVVDEFRTQFSTKIIDASIHNYNLEEDRLTINYIPIGSDSPVGTPSIYQISDVEKGDYIDKLMYYVTKDVIFIPRYDHSDAVKLTLDITLYVSEEVDVTSLTDHVEGLEYKLGGSVNTDELLGNIINLEGVNYAKIELTDENNNLLSGEYTLGPDQYYILTENFTYSYKL